MKKICSLLVLVSSIGHGQTNTYPTSGNVKIFAADEAWAEGVTVVKPSSWGGLRLTRNDPATGNYNGNWALGYNASTGNDFSISTNYNGTQYDGLFHISNSTRNVGIGTTNPIYALDVQGFGSRLLNPSTAAGAYTSFRMQGPNYTNGLEIDFFGNYNISTDLNWTYGGGAGSVAIVNVNAKPLTFGTNNQGRMLIDATGNVGIGTFAPDAKLSVSGQVHAQEVKVSITVPGPDYVFEKDYQLTSLEEIKNYIDQNKHLPEVPSAKEMEKNGVQLGEMNMLLLKKIEELTLYVIELKKEVQELKDNQRPKK